MLQAIQCGASFVPVYVGSQTTASGAKRPLQYSLFWWTLVKLGKKNALLFNREFPSQTIYFAVHTLGPQLHGATGKAPCNSATALTQGMHGIANGLPQLRMQTSHGTGHRNPVLALRGKLRVGTAQHPTLEPKHCQIWGKMDLIRALLLRAFSSKPTRKSQPCFCHLCSQQRSAS